MNLSGHNFIGNVKSAPGSSIFKAVNPSNGKELETDFQEATAAEVDQAVQKVEQAFKIYRNKSKTNPALTPRRIMDGVIHGVNVGGNCSGNLT